MSYELISLKKKLKLTKMTFFIYRHCLYVTIQKQNLEAINVYLIFDIANIER